MSPNRNISRPRRCLPDNRARLLTCQTSSRARHTRLSDHFGRRAAAVECVGRRVRAPTTSSVPGRPRPLRHLVSAGAYIIIRRARYIVRRPYRCTYRVSYRWGHTSGLTASGDIPVDLLRALRLSPETMRRRSKPAFPNNHGLAASEFGPDHKNWIQRFTTGFVPCQIGFNNIELFRKKDNMISVIALFENLDMIKPKKPI